MSDQAHTPLRKLVTLAMLGALSVVLVALVHFPLFPAAAYLEYDPADIPVLIAAFAFGPVYGLLLTAVVSLVQGFTVSVGSGLYGILMHFIATGVFVGVAGLIYNRGKTQRRAVIALLVGCLAMAAVMCGANMLITPLFTGMPTSAVADLLLPVILPFNLIKAGINALLTFLVYKPISNLIHREYGRR